ncbi:hypothetical protein HPP92_012061 [Vanilla planifolia]|uniref:Serine aminopeptidase S33 domain-containing protein n=1 Tax=Vanilla planifolia TaxID=51239 RepID=A0A835R7B4_VANPL|nr:hypothetical protein HPP92_012061 [Vanilla planifolia]
MREGADYNPANDLLDEQFMLKGRWFHRKDLEVTNSKGNVLRCSHYLPLEVPEGKALPCVIYCHGNSGCRADASEAAIILLPSNISVFALDFSGSGLSDGEHVTLGWNEKDDLKVVVNYLRSDANVSCIGLWGDLWGCYKVKLAIQHMRRIIRKKANFDIMDLDAIQPAKCCFVPVLIGHATDDDFIQPHHSDRIYDAYAGDKNIIKFDGDHNSPRPQFYFDSITIFFHNVLNPPKDSPDENYLHTMHDYFDQDNWAAINEVDYGNQRLILPPSELATNSTEDAISQLRSKRPMSRMEVPSEVSCTENMHKPEDNGDESDLDSSSSKVFVGNVSNAHSSSRHIPGQSNGECLAYNLDGFPDIPVTIEDEERMIMEAIIESLRDMKQEQNQKDEQCSASAAASHLASSAASVSNCLADDAESCATITSMKPSNEATLETNESCKTEAIISKECSTANGSSSGSRSLVGESNSEQESEMADGTRATLVVQKSSAGHGANRWGSLFRTNR